MRYEEMLIICAIPTVIGIVAAVYAMGENALKEPLSRAILVLPIADTQTPAAELLRVVRFGAINCAVVVVDMNGSLQQPEKLVEEGLCDIVTDPDGLQQFLRARMVVCERAES